MHRRTFAAVVGLVLSLSFVAPALAFTKAETDELGRSIQKLTDEMNAKCTKEQKDDLSAKFMACIGGLDSCKGYTSASCKAEEEAAREAAAAASAEGAKTGNIMAGVGETMAIGLSCPIECIMVRAGGCTDVINAGLAQCGVAERVLPPAEVGGLPTLAGGAPPLEVTGGDSGSDKGKTSPPITMGNVKGEVSYSNGRNGEEKPYVPGTVLHEGDCINVSYESQATLTFSDGSEVQVPQLAQICIDEYLNAENRAKTQLYLRVGSVQATIKKNASIRSDLSVVTPTTNASIRGSAMVVSYDQAANMTTVYATEDKAFVQGTNDSQEQTVMEGQKSVTGADGKSSAPAPFSNDELQKLFAGSKSASPMIWPYLAAAIVAAVGVIAYALRRKKKA